LSGTACGQVNALHVATVPVTNANRKGGSQTSSVTLRINEVGLTLPPEMYTGTLNVMAQVTEGQPGGK